MVPGELDLEIYIGTHYGPVVIQCKDSEDAAVSIRGYTVYAHVRTAATGALVFNLSPTISNGDEGEITLEMTDEQTDVLTAGRFRWDLILETGAGVRIGPILKGACKVISPITQP